MSTPTRASAYDLVEFPSRPISDCQPARMASIAALAGLTPPPIETATVVDLGCGTAGNLLAIAAAYPGVTAIGVDPSHEAIARGQAIVDAAQLSNVTLVEDTQAPLADGQADYVIAHGVLSWVDEATREGVIAEAARIAGDGALIYFSYNADPGSLPRYVSRWIGRRVSGAKIAAGDAVGAHAAMRDRLSLAASSPGADSAYAKVAARQHQFTEGRDPFGLFHDELNENWAAISVTALASQTLGHGLSYVGELLPGDRWRTWTTPEVTNQIAQAAGPSAAAQQQQHDDLSGAPFHDSLFVKGQAPVPAVGGIAALPDGYPAAGWHVRWVGGRAATGDDPAAAVAEAVEQAGVAGISVGEVAEQTGLEPSVVLAAASLLDARKAVTLAITAPPAAAEPIERPVASALARAQVRAGHEHIASLRHSSAVVHHGPHRELIRLLDGTRDRAALAEALDLAGLVDDGVDAGDLVETCLAELCQAGFLALGAPTTGQEA